MASYAWNGATADYLDAAQWTPVAVPFYGAGTIATIAAGSATLANSEPNGITIDLTGGAELLLANAALGPQLTLAAGANATLGVKGWDSNFGDIAVAGTLTIDSPGYGWLNQSGILSVAAGAALLIDADVTLNNIGTVALSGGNASLAGSLVGTGAFSLAGSAALDLSGPVGAGQVFDLSAGTLRLDDVAGFAGTLADFTQAGARLTVPQTIESAGLAALYNGQAVLLLGNGNGADFQPVASIPLAGAIAPGFTVTNDPAGGSTITPDAAAGPIVLSDGSIPARIFSGMVVLLNSEPNGVTVSLGGDSAAGQPTLVLNNAALGPQLALGVANPSGPAYSPYATINIEGYSTNYGSITASAPSAGQLTVSLGAWSQFNQFGSIEIGYPMRLLVENTTPGAPGTLNNGGVIDVNEGGAVIDANVIGSGTIALSYIPHLPLGPASVELGAAVAPGQTIEMLSGSLQLDDPARFLGTLRDFINSAASLHLAGLQADSAQGSGSSLTLSAGGTTVARFSLGGQEAAAYATLYDSGTNTTTVVPSVT